VTIHKHQLFLDLETLRPSATTSALELPALALDVRLLVLVRTEAEVLDGLAGVLGSTEEEDVGASGRAEGQLVECEALTAGLLNTGTSSSSEAKSGDAHFRDLVEAVVIGDGAYDRTDLALR